MLLKVGLLVLSAFIKHLSLLLPELQMSNAISSSMALNNY